MFVGCPPPLGLGSPAKSLRLRVCHIFWEFFLKSLHCWKSSAIKLFSSNQFLVVKSVLSLHSTRRKIGLHCIQSHTCLNTIYRKSKNPPNPCAYLQRSFPQFLNRHCSTLPPSLNSQSARAHFPFRNSTPMKNRTSIASFHFSNAGSRLFLPL